MLTLRSSFSLTACALAAVVALAPPIEAQQDTPREPYPATLHFGTGLINTPVAWVSPRSGDLWLQTSGKNIEHQPGLNFWGSWNTNLSLETHWLERFTVGVSLYSQNPEWGLFARALLLRDGDVPLLPAVAVGVRNVSRFRRQDRHLVGHDIVFVGDGYEQTPSTHTQNFDTAPTIYAVATKEYRLGGAQGSFSVGWGNGIFSDDGGLGREYNMNGQIVEGMFLGTRLAFQPTLNTTITLMAENDAWDWNAGIAADWRGITLGLYGTELEEGGMEPGACTLCRVYNYAKMNVSLGYSGNIGDISRGVILRSRVTELERDQQRLRAEIATRERQIARLEGELRRAQAGELAEIARRREELETQIRQERDAIRQAEERLRQLEQQRPRPETPPPGGSQSSSN